MTTNFKLKPITLAMIPILFAGGSNFALAQDSEKDAKQKKKDEKANVEVIEVTGYRGSIQRSINSKRLADGVQDSIFAEDIGKSTDQNIADALSRITGVTVQESDGEGTKISVRGAPSSLNQISLNGVALTSSLPGGEGDGGSSDQSVDLSSFSSDILSSINVIKTSAADHDEGSLGATVILRTVKPLLIDKDRRTLELQGRYNEYAAENDFKISGSFSEKFFDDNLGMILTASKEQDSTRRDQVGGNWLNPYDIVTVEAGRARDSKTGELITETQKAFYNKTIAYDTHLSNRERDTVNLGIQWLPGDTTDVQLDLSYAKAKTNTDRHGISIGNKDLNQDQWKNHYVGQELAQNTYTYNVVENPTNPFELAPDPQQDWWDLDQDTNTITKMLNRSANGGFGRSVGGNQTENKVATLTISHEITDDLLVDFTAGYSRTNFESLPNWTLGTANWKTTNGGRNLDFVPADEIVPIGMDCNSGECIMVTGQDPLTFAPNGNGNGHDNIANNAFSPYDPHQQHIGYLAQYNQTSTDTNKSVFLDFDWSVDTLGLTLVEFGAKWSNRQKPTYGNNTTFDDPSKLVYDDRGNLISGNQASDLRVSDFLGGTGIPVEDFMGELINTDSAYNLDFLNGWGILDPAKATAAMFNNNPNIQAQVDDRGTRDLEQDNVSAYAKVNFEYFDGKLTGNVGVRYVKTENNSQAFSTMTFIDGHGVMTPWDLVGKAQIFNSDIGGLCDPKAPGPNGGAYYEVWEEFGSVPEKLCYDNKLQYDWSAAGGATDKWFADESFEADYSDPNNPVILKNELNGQRSWWNNHRWNDLSTTRRELDAAVNAGIIESEQDGVVRLFGGEGGGESELWLPSLNLNYAISDEMIVRFATSRTMARPPFDAMKPGFEVREDAWTPGANRITRTNPELKPLESKNLDLSFEWYFDKTGLISLAYFRKDMSNFTEDITSSVFIKDIRHDYNLEAINWEDFHFLPGEYQENDLNGTGELNTVNPWNVDCLPFRAMQAQINQPFDLNCREFTATVKRNGAKAKTEGIEFSYNQTYDFLPGFLSGLGTNFNYTFADSESAEEYVEEFEKTLKALPQAYTPRHSANTTLFWEKSGHQIRLTHRFTDDQLVNREVHNGATWQEQSQRLDFSASYKYDKNISFSFHALNLTDELRRTYYTSTSNNFSLVDGVEELLDEGNALTDDVNTSRTVSAYKTGRTFRLSARINF